MEEDVSAFYLEFGALDIFVELFSNPNHRFNAQIFPVCDSLLLNCYHRVKEIAVGIMANMLCHEKVFLGIVEKQRYISG